MPRKQLLDALLAIPILCFGTLYCMHYGYHGLHPLDSGIVFEGAWRLMCGEQFITDFDTPNGFVPIQIQVLFFKLFGVNWWAYRLHAGIFNGLFGLMVFWILGMAGSQRLVSFTMAVLSCVVFYPPMGVPYMEQHAFFFLLLGVALTLRALRPGARVHWWLALVPATWMLAILSKQNPGLLSPVVCGIAWLGFGGQRRLGATVMGMGMGLLAGIIVFFGVIGMPWELTAANWADFWEHFWALPQEVGAERLAEWPFGRMQTVRMLLWLPYQVLLPLVNFQFRFLLIVPVAMAAVEWTWRRIKGYPPMHGYSLGNVFLGIGLVLLCTFFMRTSQNQLENGLCLAFLAVGLGMVHWERWFREGMLAARWPALATWAWRVCWVFLVGTSVLAGIQFDRNTNQTRLVLDIPAAAQANSLAAPKGGIDGLEFWAPYEYGFLDPGRLLSWLDRHPGEVMYWGDMRFLMALSERQDPLPFLWIHPGLTLSVDADGAVEEYDQELLAGLRDADPRYAIFEQPERLTYMGFQWECLPESAAFIEERVTLRDTLGGFTIWTLAD